MWQATTACICKINMSLRNFSNLRGMSAGSTSCTWSQVNKDAAWYYDQPKEAAENIKDHVAFWRGVEVKIN